MGTLHDPNKVLMGSVGSNIKEVTNLKGATVIPAGTRVCLKSDDTPSVALSDGEPIGISLGRDLSDTGRTAIARKGLRVPVLLDTGYDPVPGEQVAFIDATGIARAYTGSGDSYVNAVFATGRIGGNGATGGVVEGATGPAGSVGVALIDFPGGL